MPAPDQQTPQADLPGDKSAVLRDPPEGGIFPRMTHSPRAFPARGLSSLNSCVRCGYVNLIISGKRPCTERMARAIAQACGDAAPLQWICWKAGAELYIDPQKAQAALLRAQADEIERAA